MTKVVIFLFPESRYFLGFHSEKVDFRTKINLEEKDGQLSAYEFKWNPNAKVSVPAAFARTYPTAAFKVIHPENIEEFIIPAHK